MIIKDLTQEVTTATPDMQELNHVWKANVLDDDGLKWIVIATARRESGLARLIKEQLKVRAYLPTCMGVTACSREAIIVLTADLETYTMMIGERIRIELKLN